MRRGPEAEFRLRAFRVIGVLAGCVAGVSAGCATGVSGAVGPARSPALLPVFLLAVPPVFRAPSGPPVHRLYCRCFCCLCHRCSGRRRARPPAHRPRCELRSARRFEARPGPAAPPAPSTQVARGALIGQALRPRRRPPRGCRALSNIAHGCDGAALLSGCVRVQACCQVVLHHLGGYYTTSEVV